MTVFEGTVSFALLLAAQAATSYFWFRAGRAAQKTDESRHQAELDACYDAGYRDGYDHGNNDYIAFSAENVQ